MLYGRRCSSSGWSGHSLGHACESKSRDIEWRHARRGQRPSYSNCSEPQSMSSAIKPRDVKEITSGLPRLWCDFNAQGLSEKPSDRYFYSFDKDTLAGLTGQGVTQVFLFDYDYGEGEPHDLVVGCDATLEIFQGKWRALPDDKTWCRGRLIGSTP